jgi:hypothetical protein
MAFEHDRAQIQRRAVGSNRPFAHSGMFCGHKSTKQPLKPLRAGMPGCSGGPVVTNARVYYTTRAAAGASAPGIPHALLGGQFMHDPGAPCRGTADPRLERVFSRFRHFPFSLKRFMVRRGFAIGILELSRNIKGLA